MINVEGLTYRYPNRPHPAINDLSLRIEDGEFVLIAGRNGSGKTTLLKYLLAITSSIDGASQTGYILVDGEDIDQCVTSQLAGRIGILLQDPVAQITNLTVAEEVAFGPANLCWPKSKVLAATTDALECVGLYDLGSLEATERAEDDKRAPRPLTPAVRTVSSWSTAMGRGHR